MTTSQTQLNPAPEKQHGERHNLIADAAISVLAQQGSRGLTHRAVDSHAGLPEGSTSNLFRTRGALIEAVLDRHVERELELLDAVRRNLPEKGIDSDYVAALTSGFIEATVAADSSDLAACRYELFLEVRRTPELAERLAKVRASFEQLGSVLLSEIGIENNPSAATAVVALLDGLTVDGIFHPESCLTHEQRLAHITSFLKALATP
jgi:DNA-binding transcriptional regulator YbjK